MDEAEARQEIADFAKAARARAQLEAEKHLSSLIARMRSSKLDNQRSDTLNVGTTGSKSVLSTHKSAPSFSFPSAEAHIHPRFARSDSSMMDVPVSSGRSDMKSKNAEEELAYAEIERAPWFYTASKYAKSSNSCVYAAEKEANAQARMRLLQVLGSEFGTTPDTVGVSHLPRGVRINRSRCHLSSANNGPGRYEVTPSAESIISKRCIFNYKANLKFGPGLNSSKQQVIAPVESLQAAVSPHPPRPSRKVRTPRKPHQKPTMVCPQEVLLCDIASYLVRAEAESQNANVGKGNITDLHLDDASNDSFWSEDEQTIFDANEGVTVIQDAQSIRDKSSISLSAREVEEEAKESDVSPANTESSANPLVHDRAVEFAATRKARDKWAATQARWLALLGKERWRKSRMTVSCDATMRFPVRNITFAAVRGNTQSCISRRHRRVRPPRTRRPSPASALAKMEKVQDTIARLNLAVDAYLSTGKMDLKPQPTIEVTSADDSFVRPGYYRGAVPTSWARQVQAESFSRAVAAKRRVQPAAGWYATQLHTEYVHAVRSNRHPNPIGGRSLSAPKVMSVSGTAVSMAKQPGREDLPAADLQDGNLLYDAQAAKDYLSKKNVLVPLMAKSTARPTDLDDAPSSVLDLHPSVDFVKPRRPSASRFSTADRFSDTKEEETAALDLDISRADAFLRKRRGTTVQYDKLTGRESKEADEDDAVHLDLQPNFGAVLSRPTRGLSIDYHRDHRQSRDEEESKVDGPVLLLKPDDAYVRPSMPLTRFSRAERVEQQDDLPAVLARQLLQMEYQGEDQTEHARLQRLAQQMAFPALEPSLPSMPAISSPVRMDRMSGRDDADQSQTGITRELFDLGL